MPFQVRGASLPLDGGTLCRTVAHSFTGRNSFMILLAAALGCVINGDTLSEILRQATWLIVAVIILVVVRIVERFTQRFGTGLAASSA